MAAELSRREGVRRVGRKDVFLPVLLSAFVAPGAGQIYNRDFKRGLVLLGLTCLYMMTFVIGVGSEAVKVLPADRALWDAEQMRKLADHLWQGRTSFMRTFNWLMTATWVYSVIDAYFGARDRIRRILGIPDESVSE